MARKRNTRKRAAPAPDPHSPDQKRASASVPHAERSPAAMGHCLSVPVHGDASDPPSTLLLPQETVSPSVNRVESLGKENIPPPSSSSAMVDIFQPLCASTPACIVEAAQFLGKSPLQNMREIIQQHVLKFQNTMFESAKNAMLDLLLQLMVEILGLLEKNMTDSIELSLKTEDCSIPDVSLELAKVQKLCNELNRTEAKISQNGQGIQIKTPPL